MISVWPKFYRGNANFDALDAAGFLYRPNLVEGKKDFLGNVFTVYDAFNPARASSTGRRSSARSSQRRRVDAWWMDATEPEVYRGPVRQRGRPGRRQRDAHEPDGARSAARVLNAYSLVNSQAIYEGSARGRAQPARVHPHAQRVRGMQRYGAAAWSGDISSTWTALRKQIPAGLGFSISGIPYWTVDSGGFSGPLPLRPRPARGPPTLDEWRELNARWFEFATFRAHPARPRPGPEARDVGARRRRDARLTEAELKFDRLATRLLPYVYSLAGRVTHRGGTILRPLVMDFPRRR